MAIRHLTNCRKCGADWTQEVGSGRLPVYCPTCKPLTGPRTSGSSQRTTHYINCAHCKEGLIQARSGVDLCHKCLRDIDVLNALGVRVPTQYRLSKTDWFSNALAFIHAANKLGEFIDRVHSAAPGLIMSDTLGPVRPENHIDPAVLERYGYGNP